MKKIRKNSQFSDLVIGFLVGAIANSMGVLMWWGFFFRTDFMLFLQEAFYTERLGTIISLSALLSLGAFFLFLHHSFDIRARGVVLWVFVVAFATMYLQFFVYE